MVTMIIARELAGRPLSGGRDQKYPLAKVERAKRRKPGSTGHEDGSVQFFPTPLPPAVFVRLRKTDELPLPGDLALEKCAPFAAALKNAFCHQRPARAASGQSNRQHSRYSVRGVGRRLVAGFQRSAAGYRCAGALPPVAGGEIFAAAKAQETRAPPPPPIRNLHMDSAPAPWPSSLRCQRLRYSLPARSALGIGRGRHPFPRFSITRRRCR